MTYEIDGIAYNVVVVRKGNKNTYVRINEKLEIYVTTNFFTTSGKIKKLLDENTEFLRKAINKKKIEINKKGFYLMGKKYDIVIDSSIKGIDIYDGIIKVKNKKYLDNWYKKEIIRIFEERLLLNYKKFSENIPYPKLKIRQMKTRWGVCNRRDKSVTLNISLMNYDYECLDYVIIHELCHLVHFNHSAKFWALVTKYCPNYKLIKKELKK